MPNRRRKSPEMRCLSLRQPWASMVVSGRKDVENRSWRTNYRGPLLIHASRTVDRDACRDYGLDPDSLPTGVILGVVTVANCTEPEKPCRSKWAKSGLYHWLLTDPRLLRRPVPVTGRVGFFKVSLDCLDSSLGRKVLAQVEAEHSRASHARHSNYHRRSPQQFRKFARSRKPVETNVRSIS